MTPSATIRGTVADGADGERIDRLAALAGRHAPEGALLLAEVNGDPIAAVGIFDGRTIFDPSRSTRALRMRLRLMRLPVRLLVTMYGL